MKHRPSEPHFGPHDRPHHGPHHVPPHLRNEYVPTIDPELLQPIFGDDAEDVAYAMNYGPSEHRVVLYVLIAVLERLDVMSKRLGDKAA
jgi:hypothetical protein